MIKQYPTCPAKMIRGSPKVLSNAFGLDFELYKLKVINLFLFFLVLVILFEIIESIHDPAYIQV